MAKIENLGRAAVAADWKEAAKKLTTLTMLGVFLMPLFFVLDRGLSTALASVLHAEKLMDGSITVKTEPDKGTVFTIKISRTRATREEAVS